MTETAKNPTLVVLFDGAKSPQVDAKPAGVPDEEVIFHDFRDRLPDGLGHLMDLGHSGG